MRMRLWMSMLVLAITSAAMAAPPPPRQLTADHLVFPGVTVETRIDVNGAAAMHLLGGVLDTAAIGVKRYLQEEQEQDVTGKAQEEVTDQLAMIDSAKEALKSLTAVKLVIMKKTKTQTVDGEAFLKHYQGLMHARGWSPLLSFQQKDGSTILAMMAPGGKGVFYASNDKGSDIISGLITTEKPLGDLITKMLQGKTPTLEGLFALLSKIIMSGSSGATPAPAAQSETAPKPTEPAPPVQSEPAPAPEAKDG